MANHCHMYQHGNQGLRGMGFILSAVIVIFVWGVVCSGCAAYTIRNHHLNSHRQSSNKGQQQLINNNNSDGTSMDDAETTSPTDELDIDRFYFPTDEGLREFQHILLRELGLTKVPDLSKVNITRDEYDRQRHQLLNYFDEDDTADEYRQFNVNQEEEDERRETIILNHRDVGAIRRHVESRGVAWKLRFRAPYSGDGTSRLEAESSHPLELHWSSDRSQHTNSIRMKNLFRSLRSWKLHVRIESDRSRHVVVIGPNDLLDSLDDRNSGNRASNNNSIKPDLGARGQLLNDWLNELNNLNSNQLVVDGDHVLTVSVVCHGRDCHSLRHWRLSAQLRLVQVSSSSSSSSRGVQAEEEEDSSGGRVKRHIGKKNAVKNNNKNNSNNNNSSNKKRMAPQPKDILLGQYSSGPTNKKGVKGPGAAGPGKSGGSDCSSSNSKKSKKCCPHSLKINFRQLPGFDWILEPSEIDIFMCKGDCHYAQFTSQHQHAVSNPASNHALFQGYLHTINKRLVPKLCCTPSKLDSVQVVHYDQENPAQLTTTKWEGAIVKECACA